MSIFLKEHITHKLLLTDDLTLISGKDKPHYLWNEFLAKIKPRKFKTERGKDYPCFTCKITDKEVILNSDYFVGVDWLTKDRFIYIEPKLNVSVINTFEEAITIEEESFTDKEIVVFNETAQERLNKEEAVKEIDVIAMLMKIMSHSQITKETDKLLLIDWEMNEIPITQKLDLLTPFLVVKFLKHLQDIARKGLKKSYYKVQENLRNRVKGKIMVGKQIKQNIFKNRFTNTVCEYQVFGEDSIENRFLKKVFSFCSQYVENNPHYFRGKNDISWMVNYIRPTFEHIVDDVDVQELRHFKHNPFFKEYKEAIKIGQLILKRFSYNITKTTEEKVSTPPFWIDMPKMFELYVYAKLLEDNPSVDSKRFNYQFATHGNSLDFLICQGNNKIVVDTKYKLKYNYSQIHKDIRQVAGYARLRKVRNHIDYSNINEEVSCLIIYPTAYGKVDDSGDLKIDNLIKNENEIQAYHKIYKLGTTLPLIP